MAKPIFFGKRDTPGQKRIFAENLIAVWYTYENKLKNYFDNVEVEVYMKVKLDVVIDAIEMVDDNYTYFLDLETGKSVFLADELITGLDNEGLEEEIEENYGSRYLRLSTKFDIHEYYIIPRGRRHFRYEYQEKRLI